MNTETSVSTPQEVGGSPQQCGENADKDYALRGPVNSHDNAAATDTAPVSRAQDVAPPDGATRGVSDAPAPPRADTHPSRALDGEPAAPLTEPAAPLTQDDGHAVSAAPLPVGQVVPLDPSRPVVQAEFVTPPPLSSADDDARRIAGLNAARGRAARRRELFAVFFEHKPGPVSWKHRRASALLDHMEDSDERRHLQEMLDRLMALADSAAPEQSR